jgi:hypothetical protein
VWQDRVRLRSLFHVARRREERERERAAYVDDVVLDEGDVLFVLGVGKLVEHHSVDRSLRVEIRRGFVGGGGGGHNAMSSR